MANAIEQVNAVTTPSRAFRDLLAELVEETTRTRHHGKPGLPAATKRRYAARFADAIAPKDLASVDILLSHPLPSVRQVGGLILAREGMFAPETIAPRARRLALDEDWEVREWAVEPYLRTLGHQPLAGLQSWIEAGGRLRRAAVLAVRALVLDGTLSASASLRALDAVIDDPDSYVQASVGGFLAGDALFRRYPRETAAYLAERVRAGAVNPVFWKNVRDALRSNGARAGWTLIRDHLAAWTAAPVPAAVRRELDRLSEKEDVHA